MASATGTVITKKSFALMSHIMLYYIALVINRSGYYLCMFLDTFFFLMYIYIYHEPYIQSQKAFKVALLSGVTLNYIPTRTLTFT